MELATVFKTRRSIRAYLDKAVEPSKLQAVTSGAVLGPTAGSLQAFKAHIIRAPATKQALAAAAHGQDFLAQAPVVLVFCADLSRATHLGQPREENYSVQDSIVAAAYAQLAATAQGLATCWVGGFDSRQVARALHLPRTERPTVLMPLGYAAETPKEIPRRALTDLVVDHPA